MKMFSYDFMNKSEFSLPSQYNVYILYPFSLIFNLLFSILLAPFLFQWFHIITYPEK